VILKVLSFATTCLKQENHSLSAREKKRDSANFFTLSSSSIDDEMNVKEERKEQGMNSTGLLLIRLFTSYATG
jgi:hypothetical protein